MRKLRAVGPILLLALAAPAAVHADALYVLFSAVRAIEIRGNADQSRANLIVYGYDSSPATVTVSSGEGLPAVGTTFKVMNFLFSPTSSPSLLDVRDGCADYAVLVQRDPATWRIAFVWEKGEGGFATLDSATGWLALFPGTTASGAFRCSLQRNGPAPAVLSMGAGLEALVDPIGGVSGPVDSP